MWYMFKKIACFISNAVLLQQMKAHLKRPEITNKGRILNHSLSLKQKESV